MHNLIIINHAIDFALDSILRVHGDSPYIVSYPSLSLSITRHTHPIYSESNRIECKQVFSIITILSTFDTPFIRAADT